MKKPQVLFCKLKNRMLSDLNILQKLVFFKHFFACKLPILVKRWGFGFLSWLQKESPCFFLTEFLLQRNIRFLHFKRSKACIMFFVSSKKLKLYKFTFCMLKNLILFDFNIVQKIVCFKHFLACNQNWFSNGGVSAFSACEKWIRTVLPFLRLCKVFKPSNEKHMLYWSWNGMKKAHIHFS